MRAGVTLAALGAAVLVLLLAVPLVALVWRTFGLAGEGGGGVGLGGALVAQALQLSLGTSFGSLAVALLCGTPLAYGLARLRFPGHGLVEALIEIPVVLPPAVAGIALLMAFGRRGLVGAPLADVGVSVAFTPVAVVLAQCFVAVPFYVRAARTGFAGVARDLEGAARVDGASGWDVFRYVTAPLAFPSLLAGGVLCWARALGEFGATIMFAGSFRGRTQTMPLAIYAALESDLGAALTLSTILVVVSVLVLALVRRLASRIPYGPLDTADAAGAADAAPALG
jgi:molybdate transport system permease protein